jgi:hypothetical protein
MEFLICEGCPQLYIDNKTFENVEQFRCLGTTLGRQA